MSGSTCSTSSRPRRCLRSWSSSPRRSFFRPTSRKVGGTILYFYSCWSLCALLTCACAFHSTVIGFWTVVNLVTDGLLLTAFGFRIHGIVEQDEDKSANLRLLSFQFLSCVSPFIWIKVGRISPVGSRHINGSIASTDLVISSCVALCIANASLSPFSMGSQRSESSRSLCSEC